jgi:5-methylcytosine-specific restriction endonuclease McrA
MPANLGFLGLSRLAKPLTGQEGRKILERDRYRCQYCGLDGLTSFENSLIMSVDFIQPRARKGKKEPENLVTACRPCNRIKGSRVFASFDEAQKYVVQRRAELRSEWETTMDQLRGRSAKA